MTSDWLSNRDVTIPGAHLLFSGDYSRSGGDLIVSDQFHRVVVPNYFLGEKRPALVSPDGAQLDPSFIEAMTGHVQYAQAGSAVAAKVVGHVVKMTGNASVVRNGVTVTLNNGDTILRNDVVQTGSGSSLGLVMIDGTTFNLSAGARLMLNDLTYDAGSIANDSTFTLIQGAANFVAGQVAKTGDMKVATPVATMGIRGTAVMLDISAADGKVSISVIDQRDGQTHFVQVFNSKGVLIGTVSSNAAGLTLTPIANFDVIAQESNKTVAQITQEFSVFQSLLQTYDVGKLLFPDLPQHTDASPNTTKFAFGSSGGTSSATEYRSPENTAHEQTSNNGETHTTFITLFSPSITTGFTDLDANVVVQVADNTAPPVTLTGSLMEDDATAARGMLGLQTYQAVPTAALVGIYGNFTFDESSGVWTYALVHSRTDSLAAGQVVHDTLTVTDGTALQVIEVTIIGTNDVPVLAAGTVANGSIELPEHTTSPSTLTPAAAALLESGPGLIRGLDGSSGFGVLALSHGDDNSSNAIDITSVFGPDGINFFGHAYTSIYINNNGNITFGAPSSTFTPTQIDAGFGNPIIAVFWADVDTRAAGNVYYCLDAAIGVMTITWDGVGYYDQHSDKINSFQIMLVNEGYGNFDIVYRYLEIEWTTGDVSGGAPARAGYSAGDGVHYLELPQSGSVSALLSLPAMAGNTAVAGVDQFNVQNGIIGPSTLTTAGVINFYDVDLLDVHTVTSVTYTGGGDQLGTLTLIKTTDSTESGTAGQFVWTYSADQRTVGTALVSAGAHNKIETFDVVISDGHGGTINQIVSVTLTASNQGPVAGAVTLPAGNEDTAYTINAAALLAGVVDFDRAGLSISALSVASGGGTIFPIDNDTWNYTPAASYNGPVSFNYSASDGSVSSSSTASLTVEPVNDPAAVSGPVTGTANEDGSPVGLSAIANDSDVDSDTLEAGNFPIRLPAGVSYDPIFQSFVLDPSLPEFQHLAAGETTTVAVNFDIFDGQVNTPGSVLWALTGRNDSPLAVADEAAGTENQLLIIDVLANDTDADDRPVFTLTTVSAPSGKGTATAVANQLRFTPGTDFDHLALGVIEQVTLSYTMQDQLGATSAGIAVVTITGTNDSPVSTVAVMQTIAEDTAIVFNSANGNAISVSDVDVIAANHTITLAVTNGTLTLSGTAGLSFSVGNGATDTMMTFSGTIEAINIALNGMSYAPTPNYHGGAVIAVTIDDNIGGASLNDTKTVAINVTPVDDDLVVARTTATGFVPSSALTATADILIGAGGNDTFVFHSTSVGDETIVDFTSGADLLQISVAGAGFAGYGLAADAAVVVMNTDSIYGVTSASSGTFIFDTTAQSLYWDADGGLGANAVLLARLQNVSSLFALDFHLA